MTLIHSFTAIATISITTLIATLIANNYFDTDYIQHSLNTFADITIDCILISSFVDSICDIAILVVKIFV